MNRLPHWLQCAVMVLMVVAVLLGVALLSFLCWRTSHPGLEWWRFLFG